MAEAALEWIQALGAQIGLSFQPLRTLGPATCVEFLGLELDTDAMEARLPADKLAFLIELIAAWNLRKTCTLRELQELIGFLQLAARVVTMARAPIRRFTGN